MKSPDKEALKGMLLDRWMDDLRQDRAPTVLPEMQQLDQCDIAETLALARWLMAPTLTSPNPEVVDSVVSAVRTRIREEEDRQYQALEDAVAQATGFGGLLLVARGIRHLRPGDVERAAGLLSGMLARLEDATLAPHRIPIDIMMGLLRSLRIATGEVVELVHQAGVEWANRVHTQPATQLGRVDSQLDAESRHRLLAEATVEDEQERLAAELERVEGYCRSLAARLI